ncbi:MAG: replicative DNA helicase [Pseudohongiellaceae bacterium]|uniref:Replicative DNA helicase n=1 Tax=OM182 bacterium MED-G28 TaxID=1986256 RepID=A0A2A5WFX5_9GAMM|nr:replicative DNA helicase [Gammaproteobacteria bacterium]PDH35016.1 MAG: replicative DNA helicase [OM182 bacterium MED-G28]
MSEIFEPSTPSLGRNPSNLTALKVPPHSVEAEQAVLGGLMIDNSEWDTVADAVLSVDFYRSEHQLIFQTMTQQSEARSPIDVVTLVEALDSLKELENAGGLDYLSELAGNARGTANIHAYTDIIRERAILRRLISVANNIADTGYNTGGKKAAEILNGAEQQVFNIRDERPKDQGPVPINPLLSKAVDRVDELAGLDGSLTGLASGYQDLDEMTSGWQKSDLVIVAGRPSMGKTAFAMNLVENAVLTGEQPVLVFSLEMPSESLIFRLLSSIGRINQTKLRTGQLTEEDWPGFNNAVSKLKDRPLFIDDSASISPMEMRARARRIVREHGQLGMIVVDYLQLMQIKGTNENRVNEISEISRSLKLLAREFECPVIALSQLNRGLEQRPNKRPQMSDLRESGAIEQDADLITFIYRDEVYNEDSPDKGMAEIIIGKHRNGPIGTVRLSFLGQFTRFESHVQPRYDDSYTHG